MWNGQIIFDSGTYSFNTTTADGCDSTAILNITINNSTYLLLKLPDVIVMTGTV